MPAPLSRRVMLLSGACAALGGCAAPAVNVAAPSLLGAPAAHLPGSHTLDLRDPASGRTWRIWLQRPEGPAPAPGYPVFYTLDGNAAFALAAQLARARDEAILSTRTVRADIDAQGYRFAITRRDGWQPLTAAGFAPEAWTSGISPALPRDAQTLSIAFDPLGAAQPTELALSDGRDVAHLSVGPDGRVHVSGTR